MANVPDLVASKPRGAGSGLGGGAQLPPPACITTPSKNEVRATPSVAAATPSITKQKSFIMENANNLNDATKKSILHIVMQEIGRKAIMGNNENHVDINLDACSDDVVNHVYNMVKARMDSLNQPVGRAS